MSQYTEFNEDLDNDFDALSLQYNLRLRTLHVNRKHGKGVRHIYEFGTVARGGIVLEVSIENRVSNANRGYFRVFNIKDKDTPLSKGLLGSGSNGEMSRLIRRILKVIFEGFEDGDDIQKIVQRLQHLHVRQEEQSEYFEVADDVSYTQEMLLQTINQAIAKGACIVGCRHSPNGKIVLTYQRNNAVAEDRFYLNMRECIQHLQAAYMLNR